MKTNTAPRHLPPQRGGLLPSSHRAAATDKVPQAVADDVSRRAQPRRKLAPTNAGGYFAGAALAVVCLLMADSALAGNTRTVTNPGDTHVDGQLSLREAIAASLDTDIVQFGSSVWGTITLAGSELPIGRNVTITGPGAKSLTISGNNASRVFNILASATAVTISGLTISGGLAKGADASSMSPSAPGQGGGIINSGTLTLTGCTITGNMAHGGIGSSTGDGTGRDGDGGGIFSSGMLTLLNCQVGANTALGGDSDGSGGVQGVNGLGGGIFSQGAFSATSCTLSGNSATGGKADPASQGSGGGIYVAAGSFVNCTVANNSTVGGENFGGTGGASSGGGVYVGATPVTLTSCTISGNNSTGGRNSGAFGYGSGGDALGGGIFGSPTLKNTIVSGNGVVGGSGASGGADGMATGPDVDGTVTSGGFNFIGNTDGSSGWNASGPGVDLTGSTATGQLDPLLGQLKDNGGPGPTMLLTSSSGAIDNGNSFGLSTDELGQARPFACYNITPNVTGGDRSDIGAVEYYPARLTMTISPSESGSMVLTYPNNSPGTGTQTHAPIFVPHQVGILGGASTPVVSPSNPVRTVKAGWLVTTEVVPGSAYFGLVGPAANVPVVPPPATKAANAVGINTATLNGTDTPAGNNNNTMYWFQYSLDGSLSSTTTTNPLANSLNQADLSASINGLSAFTAYNFQLMVHDDDAGDQPGGILTFTTTGPAPTVTTTVGGATAVTSTSEMVSGTINAEGAPNGAIGRFQYGSSPATYGPAVGTPYFTSMNGDTESYSFTITGLTPNTLYSYHAVGRNAGGTGFGADLTFTTLPAPVPPMLVSPGNGTAPGPTIGTLTPTFTWNAASGAASYGLNVTLYPSGTPVYTSTTLAGTSYPLPGGILAAGTQYAWSMTSFNGGGEQSAPSGTYYFQTGVAPSVQNLAAINITQTSASLRADVNPNGLDTKVYFQYGTDTTYIGACAGQTATQDVPTPQTVILTASPLCNKRPYYFRAVVYNSIGTNYAGPATFNTP